MKIRSFTATILGAALGVGLSTTVLADQKADFDAAWEAADAARKKAGSAGSEWRDTGKMLGQAKKAAEAGEYDKAMGLIAKAKRQGELGYEQGMSQKDADMPAYMKGGSKDEKDTAAPAVDNRITEEIESVEVMHDGEKVVIIRGHDKEATLPAEFLKTDRGCPPFCVQPMTAAEGVETVGEIELLSFLKQATDGDASILVVDSRTPDWVTRGTIPGSVNVPWNQIGGDQSGMFGDSGDRAMQAILVEQFGAKEAKDGWDFSDAKTLVLFCNGIWCGQSAQNIATLSELGYPADKLKWYRGGMQDWVSAGLTTVKP